MKKVTTLKPPFDVEFPHSERALPEPIERAVELGVMTPRMIGYHSSDTASLGEIKVPQSAQEVDELQQEAKVLARNHGGHGDDYDWRFH